MLSVMIAPRIAILGPAAAKRNVGQTVAFRGVLY